MGVYIGGSADLGVAQAVGDDNHGDPIRNHQTGVGVPEGVNCDRRQARPPDEGGKPFCNGVWKERVAVIPGEYTAIGIFPCVP